MIIRYEYKASCCGHEYVEQRKENEPMYFSNCNTCGQGAYELVNQIVITENINNTDTIA